MALVFLVSGGTGGHIFPAEALAGILLSRGHKPVLITDNRFGKFKTSMMGVETIVVKCGLMRGGVIGKIKGILGIFSGIWQSRRLLKQYKPDVVVGFGGYPSFPTMLAAHYMGFKTIIHEQNSILGQTNFVLSSRVGLIATSFLEVKGISRKDTAKVRMVGYPVRAAVKAVRGMEYPMLHEEGVFRILVIGGSQGASVFSSVIPAALGMLSNDYRRRIRLDQQCREPDLESTREKYYNMGISADLSSFFTDVPARLASCHLVITRSGASTLAELTVAGRPAILVPYPHATDDHQRINALAMESVGAAWVMPDAAFTPEALAQKLEGFMKMPVLLRTAAEKSRSLGLPDSDEKLADLVEGS